MHEYILLSSMYNFIVCSKNEGLIELLAVDCIGRNRSEGIYLGATTMVG